MRTRNLTTVWRIMNSKTHGERSGCLLRFLWFIGGLATLFGVIADTQAAGKKYALVVGVATYRPGQPLPKLPFTENDANDLAQVLTDGGYKVKLMTQSVGRMEDKEVYMPMSEFIR